MTAADVLVNASRYHVATSRAEDYLDALPDGCVSLVFFDGPYYEVKTEEAWDNAWPTVEAFLAWQATILSRFRRVLVPNGSLYCCASPRLGSRVELNVATEFEVLTNIRWRKPASRAEACEKEALRSPFPASETIIFAEQRGADNYARGEAQYVTACDKLRGFTFEPIRAYLDGERERAGKTRKDIDAAWQAWKGGKGGMSGHWFSTSQWALPTAENYEFLRAVLNGSGGEFLRKDYEGLRKDYEGLRKDYEGLRKDYEGLRRPYSVTADVPYTDVWDFATVQAYDGKHTCEKPEPMLEHIITSSSRPDDVVLDVTCGSGVALAVAVRLGRRALGCDASEHWADATRARCEMARITGRSEVRKVIKVDDKQRTIFDIIGGTP